MCDHNDHEIPKDATWDEVKATMREMLKNISMDRDTENPLDDAYPLYPHQRAILGVNHLRSEPSSRYREMTEEERLFPFSKDHPPSGENTVTIQCVKRRRFSDEPQYQYRLPPVATRKVLSPFKFTPMEKADYSRIFENALNRLKEMSKEETGNWFIFDSWADVRPVGEPLSVDESHYLKSDPFRSDENGDLTIEPDQDDACDGQFIADIMRAHLPVGAVEIEPNIFYFPVELASGEIYQRIVAHPHTGDGGSDDDMIPIGNGQTMKRSEVRKALAKANQAIPTGMLKTAKRGLSLSSTTYTQSSVAQSVDRMKRDKSVNDMTDDELIGELKPGCFSKPNAEELDAIEYPMPGHLWTNSELSINAAVLKATTRCLWIKVELSPDCPEVHVMSREQFRSFLTHHGDHEDWKTRRPNWREPQTPDDVLRYNLTTTTYSGVDELLQHMIDQEFPYIEHTPV